MGFTLSNVDCTLVCEYPKVGPHAARMRAVMAEILGIEASRVSVKATTSERLGFTGRGEGIAAIATAALVKPWFEEPGLSDNHGEDPYGVSSPETVLKHLKEAKAEVAA